MHLFKVQLQFIDLFIESLDLSAKVIAYSVRDKETGKLLEPHFKSKLVINKNQIDFDMRHISLDMAKFIESVLS